MNNTAIIADSLLELSHKIIPLYAHSAQNWTTNCLNMDYTHTDFQKATGLKIITGIKTEKGYLNAVDFDFDKDPRNGWEKFLELLHVIGYKDFKDIQECIKSGIPFEFSKSNNVHFFFYTPYKLEGVRKSYLLKYNPLQKEEIELFADGPITIAPTIIEEKQNGIKDYRSQNNGILDAPALTEEQIVKLLEWLKSQHSQGAELRFKNDCYSNSSDKGISLKNGLEEIKYTIQLRRLDEILKKEDRLNFVLEELGLEISKDDGEKVTVFSPNDGKNPDIHFYRNNCNFRPISFFNHKSGIKSTLAKFLFSFEKDKVEKILRDLSIEFDQLQPDLWNEKGGGLNTNKLIKHFVENILKEEWAGNLLLILDTVFFYNGTNWELIYEDTIEKMIANCYKPWVYLPKNSIKELAYQLRTHLEARTYDFRKDKSYKKDMKIAFSNGTLKINKNGETTFCETHKKEDNLFCILNCDYTDRFWNKPKDNIHWEYLVEYFGLEQAKSIKLYVGACLILNLQLKKVLFVKGDSNIGKSTFFTSLMSVFNNGAQTSVSPENWDKNGMAQPLMSALINLIPEIEDRGLIRTNIFNSVTGWDEIVYRNLYENGKKGVAMCKHIMLGNDLPKMRGNDATANRFIIVEALKNFKEANQFENLDQRLLDEHSAIYFILTAIKELYEKEFEISGNNDLKKQFVFNNNPLNDFLKECTGLDSDEWCYSTDLYNRFKLWHNTSNIATKAMTSTAFGRAMSDLSNNGYFEKSKHSENRRTIYNGIKILPYVSEPLYPQSYKKC